MFRGILLCGLMIATQASALTWSDYRQHFLAEDPGLSEAQQRLLRAEAQLTEETSLNKTLLVFQPTKSTGEYEFAGMLLERDDFFLRSELQQQLAYGTELSLNYNKNLNDQVGQYERVDEEYSLGLSQALWANAFGSADRAQARAAELNYQSEKLQFALAFIESCDEALDLYAEAYRAQKILASFQLLEAEVQRAYEITRRSYRRRLVRQIDWLAAQNDLLETKSQGLTYIEQTHNSLTELKKYFQGTDTAEISVLEPVPLDEPLPTALGSEPELPYAVEAAKLLSQSQSQLYEAQISRERSQVDFNVSVGSQTGAAPLGEGVTEFNRDYVEASVRIALPLYDPARKARVMQAYTQWQVLENQAENTKDNQLSLIQTRLKTYQRLQESYKIHSERMESLVAQLSEARQLLSAGRIEYQDYLIYRDQWFAEISNGLELQTTLWQTGLAYLGLVRKESLICGDYP